MPEAVTTHQVEEDARNEGILIHVNGRVVPRAEAVVSVYDSGFLMGDGVWEGLRLYNGRWAFLGEHLDRLFEGAKALDLDIGTDRDGVVAALEGLREANDMHSDVHARLMVTRGVKTHPFQHPSLSRSGPTMVIIMEHSRPSLPRPVRLATVPHMRGLPMTQDPKLNTHSKLNCILACIAAEKAGADEALMLDVQRLRQHHQRLQLLHRAQGRGVDLDRRLLHERRDPRQGHRAVPRARHPGVPAQLLAGGHLRRRRGLPHRHLRRADAGGRHRRTRHRQRRHGPGDPAHPRPLQGTHRARVRRMRIAMWSGPRNLSTAMMYSFGARGDCAVSDEPFYAAYLAATGLEHPMREEVIAAGETDPAKVAAACAGPIPGGRPIWYQKHMTLHMLDGFPREFMRACTNVFLIRHPARVVASYARKREAPTLHDIGFVQQARLFDEVADRLGHAPPVIDSADIRRDPRGKLSRAVRRPGHPLQRTHAALARRRPSRRRRVGAALVRRGAPLDRLRRGRRPVAVPARRSRPRGRGRPAAL